MVHDVQKVRAFEHPGAGRKRAKATPKGRQVDPTAAHEIELRPELVAEVKYLTWTDDNLLRQVSYQGQREDKPARQVVRSIPHPPRGQG